MDYCTPWGATLSKTGVKSTEGRAFHTCETHSTNSLYISIKKLTKLYYQSANQAIIHCYQ